MCGGDFTAHRRRRDGGLRFFFSTVLQIPANSDLEEHEVESVVDMRLAQYVLDENWDVWQIASILSAVNDMYDGWIDLKIIFICGHPEEPRA